MTLWPQWMTAPPYSSSRRASRSACAGRASPYGLCIPSIRTTTPLLAAINRGEFAIHGLRNRDLQQLLYAQPPATPAEKRRRSAAVSRKLRLLRAHGLIRKLAHTHRYRVNQRGRLILNAILSAQRMTTQQLTEAA